MMKEEKKLLTKVKSLNRKVQNLQAKLAAKASNVVQQSTPICQQYPNVYNALINPGMLNRLMTARAKTLDFEKQAAGREATDAKART
jgi:hypothetical protein